MGMMDWVADDGESVEIKAALKTQVFCAMLAEKPGGT